MLTLSLTGRLFLASTVTALISSVAGCGGSESGAKLPEAEQQKQIQELNQQRADEWGNKAK